MSRIMRQLRTDHSHAARLLGLMDRQLDRVEAGARADFALMADAMGYMTGYADRYHHPREDLLFERLRERDRSLSEVLDTLEREHQALATRGRAFLGVLSGVVDGALAERAKLEVQGREYVAFLRAHMQREDNEVFARADNALAESDWRQIDEALEVQEDPLFGRVVQEDFQDLYRHIMREAD